jgi:hypothetical protein
MIARPLRLAQGLAPEQIADLQQFLRGFYREDGTPQPVPHRKARRYR